MLDLGICRGCYLIQRGPPPSESPQARLCYLGMRPEDLPLDTVVAANQGLGFALPDSTVRHPVAWEEAGMLPLFGLGMEEQALVTVGA